jgi:ubiquinone/menaquinone biosynthesis C-methylase UbiE
MRQVRTPVENRAGRKKAESPANAKPPNRRPDPLIYFKKMHFICIRERSREGGKIRMELDNMNPRERFSRVVHDYSKFRPGYPARVLETLVEEYGLVRASVIADIGSGTGIFSKLFVDHGNTVYAVEPNPDMRAKAETSFAGVSGFVSVNGAAESTTLPQGIADFVTAGQAFHWFDKPKTVTEFRRIIKRNGWVVLVWNKRDNSKPFMKRYDSLIKAYCPDQEKSNSIMYSEVEQNAELERFFYPFVVSKHTFDYHQVFNFEELAGRLRSSSYSPSESSDSYRELVARLEILFDEFQENGTVLFEYLTEMFVSKLY